MKVKQLLRKIHKRLFVSKYYRQAKFQVLNMHNKSVWKKYHYSVGFFCDEVILCKGKKPVGSLDIYGHDKTNIIVVPYDKRKINAVKIQNFLTNYKIEAKIIEDAPSKKFIFLTFNYG